MRYSHKNFKKNNKSALDSFKGDLHHDIRFFKNDTLSSIVKKIDFHKRFQIYISIAYSSHQMLTFKEENYLNKVQNNWQGFFKTKFQEIFE